MDKSECCKIVQENIHWLRWAMHLQDWKIDILYGLDEGMAPTIYGQCESDPSYRNATIWMNHDMHETEDGVLDTLRHELLHILHAEMKVFADHVNTLVDHTQWNALRGTRAFAIERFVGNMERMLDLGLGLTPRAMIEMAKAHQAAKDAARTKAEADVPDLKEMLANA